MFFLLTTQNEFSTERRAWIAGGGTKYEDVKHVCKTSQRWAPLNETITNNTKLPKLTYSHFQAQRRHLDPLVAAHLYLYWSMWCFLSKLGKKNTHLSIRKKLIYERYNLQDFKQFHKLKVKFWIVKVTKRVKVEAKAYLTHPFLSYKMQHPRNTAGA